MLDQYSTGNYAYTKACIKFRRLTASYNIDCLFAVLFVLMSYMGSWINPSAAPGRIAVAIISVLIVANNYNSVKDRLPPVAYNVFFMDFLLGCAFFNAATFVLYALTNFGMSTDAEIEKVRSAGTVMEDSNGILHWSELHAAVLRLRAPKGNSSPSAATLHVNATVETSPPVCGAPRSREDPKVRPAGSWDFLPIVAALKPERVRRWRYLDRNVRLCFPILFVLYLICMLSAVELWDEAAMIPVRESERC